MNLSDLYQAELPTESREFIVMRSDYTPSENKIRLIDPASDKAAKAAFMFDSAIKRKLKKYEAENERLLAECKEAGDFLEYNVGFEFKCQELRDAFCHEVVEGWDFDDEFTPENLQSALDGFRSPVLASLQRQIIDAFRAQSVAWAKK